MEVCIMPNYNRPEFLKICLEQVTKADNIKNILFVFVLDKGFDEKLINIIDEFQYDKEILKIQKRYSNSNSNCILSGFKRASELTKKLIYLIEDDVFIGKDFFNWHREIQKLNNIFCSIASKNHNYLFNTCNDLNAYYIGRDDDYQGIGTCYNKNTIDLILPHIKEEYFSNMLLYLKQNFKSYLGDSFCEQDGLIRRIKEANTDLKTVFPHVPRCYHAGFYGYHRSGINNGSFEDKVNKIRKICFDPVEMKKNCQNEYYSFDSEVCNLNTSFNKLYLKQCIIQLGMLPGIEKINIIKHKKYKRGSLTSRGLVF